MEINLFNEDIVLPELDYPSLEKWINQVVVDYKKQIGDLNFIFTSDEYMLEINKKHLEHEFYTDIITFNYCEEDTISGDIFISIDRVKENARKFQTEDTELFRVIIHGVLHLIGLNDHSDEEKLKMRAAENEALLKLQN